VPARNKDDECTGSDAWKAYEQCLSSDIDPAGAQQVSALAKQVK